MTSKDCHEVQNIPWCQWHQKHIFILFCSRNDTKNVITIKSWSWHQKYVITPKIRHYVKKARPDVKMSWCKKTTMMTKCSSLLQKVRHDIKKTSLCQKVCHDVKRFVITSKIRQMFVMKIKIRHDVKKFVMTKTRHDIKKVCYDVKTCHDVKKFVIRQKHVETSKVWHQFYISTMCRPPVINDYVFSTNLVTLTLNLFLWYSIIPRYVHR